MLLECGAPLPNGRRKHCCDNHGALVRMRRMRRRLYVLEGRRCPIDGVLVIASAHGRRGARPTYDCLECRRIAETLRALRRDEIAEKRRAKRKP